jgi:hypothetical protein
MAAAGVLKTGENVRKKQRTALHLEIEEAVSIRTRTVLIAYCRTCGKQTRMVAANEAAIVARVTAREIYRLVEAGRLHFTEDQSGLLYVCLESIRKINSIQEDLL